MRSTAELIARIDIRGSWFDNRTNKNFVTHVSYLVSRISYLVVSSTVRTTSIAFALRLCLFHRFELRTSYFELRNGGPTWIRTKDQPVMSGGLYRWAMGPYWDKNNLAPRVGLEPTTYRLTAGCSTIELSRNAFARVIIRNSASIVKSYLKIFLCAPQTDFDIWMRPNSDYGTSFQPKV